MTWWPRAAGEAPTTVGLDAAARSALHQDRVDRRWTRAHGGDLTATEGHADSDARRDLPPVRIPEALDRLIDRFTAMEKPDEGKKWRCIARHLPHIYSIETATSGR